MLTQPKPQATAHFQTPTVTEHSVHRQIGDAYRAYGLTSPSKAVEVKRLLEADANAVNVTVNRLAATALEPHSDLPAWHADALEQIRDAQARQALAQAFGNNFQRHVLATAHQYQELAYGGLAPHVAKTIKALETAAKHLPAGAAALDPEAVIAADAGKYLHSARAALATLSVPASIYLTLMDQEPPLALRQIAPIVDFPSATVEQTKQHLGHGVVTINGDKLDGTLEIREIGNHAREHGIDATLVAIARGDFPATRLAFADKAAMRERRSNLVNAYSRTTVRAD